MRGDLPRVRLEEAEEMLRIIKAQPVANMKSSKSGWTLCLRPVPYLCLVPIQRPKSISEAPARKQRVSGSSRINQAKSMVVSGLM